ncbi:hypothetical protein [Nonomuraea sp. NPDC050786]|uniref:hypothetical protein n=1 Tax=Nonomuraea sp. NPDC050786 TaxID=3154840 RepID=UPI0033D704AC
MTSEPTVEKPKEPPEPRPEPEPAPKPESAPKPEPKRALESAPAPKRAPEADPSRDDPVEAAESSSDDLMEAAEPAASAGHPVLRWALAVLANVTVMTALLVYFGWQRSAVQAFELGIDESILDMSTKDYVLRSVGPVLYPLMIIGVAGLLWLQVDHALAPRAKKHGTQDRLVRQTLRALSLAWLVLPLTMWALGFVLRTASFLAFPFSIGAGVLLTLYGTHLRTLLPGASPRDGMPLLYTFTSIIVCVSLFYGATNLAIYQGVSLAQNLVVSDLTRVTVYSTERLYLGAGKESALPASTGKAAYKYRYGNLRLFAHTGGRYFLIADDWRRDHGVVVMLAESSTIRLELGGP